MIGMGVDMRCHLCEHDLDEAPIVGTTSRGDRPSRRVCCPNCALVQVDPQPDAADLDEYYRTAYHAEYARPALHLISPQGVVEVREPDHPGYDEAVDTMHRSRVSCLGPDLQLPDGSRVIEVGCSDGRSMVEMRRQHGWDVNGIEPDPKKAAAARARGFVVAEGRLEDVVFERADAVVSFHVLEHFPSPLRALADMRRCIKPGGKLWVEVPDVIHAAPPLAHWWQHVHLFDFSAHTLLALLRRAGFGEPETGHGIEVRVPEGPSVLQGWAFDLGGEPRPYEPHGGPSCDVVVDMLRRRDAGETVQIEPEENLFKRWLEGEDLDAEQQREARREFAAYRDDVERLRAAWDDSCELVGQTSRRMGERAATLFDGHHTDPYLYGQMIGEGMGMTLAKTALAKIGNAMRAKERAVVA